MRRSLVFSGGVLAGCQSKDIPVVDLRDGGRPRVDAGFMDAGVTDAGLAGAGIADAGVATCDETFTTSALRGILDFDDANGVNFHELRNQGWDGRLYTDLSVVDASQTTIGNDEFYVRTFYPDLLMPSGPWQIEVSGLADATTLDLADLSPLAVDQGPVFLECSGNGSGAAFGLMSSAEWRGIPIAEVLGRITIDPAATRVEIGGFDDHSVPSVGGHSTPGASWIFTFDQLLDAGAFLATEMNGEPLPPNHGEPVRLMIPGWYGCCAIKWVNAIRFVDDSEPATSQMLEFASRTHQPRGAQLARDFRPAQMHQAAMPTRVERHLVDGETVYRIIGIMWGGTRPTDRLAIRFDDGPSEPVDVCPAQTTNRTWTIWEHAWRPTAAKRYRVRMAIDDPSIPTNRLDSGYYEREIVITDV
ncbi:MAG: molybdopterin-dependent oxidoreductase [Deltaproteobacteria bacterium]